MESHPRGVFRQTYEGPGRAEVMVAVDRRGRCLAHAFVTERANRQAVVRSLRGLLRYLDPPPIRLLN